MGTLHAMWDRIEALGGYGVWESDMVVVSLANTGVTDSDLELFASFPLVQILDLSHNPITDACLQHLEHVTELETLILLDTNISSGAIERFRRSHPGVSVDTEPLPPDAINPFTGEPMGGGDHG